jgi:hypothetical protein
MKPLTFLSLQIITLLLYSTTTAQVTLQFDHRAEGKKLVLNTGTYKTSANDLVTISLLQYYISNIQLIKGNGDKYTVPKATSFFLVKESIDSSKSIVLNVPDGVYSAITFLVGIDSLTSTLGIEERTGVLDPGKDMAASESMYWTWNSGYIFFKMEGSSPAIPADKTGFREFEYHIGGYGGYNSPSINNIRRVIIELPTAGPLRVRSNKTAVVHIRFEVLSVFDRLDLKQHHHLMLTPASTQVADNYAAGFKYGGTQYR